MTYSKKAFAIALVLSLATIVSCGKRDDRLSDPDTQATFYVDKGVAVWGKVIVTRDAQQKPNQKDFKIQACLKDNALMAIIQFQDFKIKAGDQEMIKTSDKFGCIIWDEQIHFDGLATETELLVVRRVEAIRGHAGGVNVELALNPWATEDTITVTDLRYDEALKTKTTADAVSYSLAQFQADDGKPNPTFSMEVNKKRVADASSVQKSKSAAIVDTRMRLDAIQLQFLGHDYGAYEITPTLNLKVAHKYRIRISPQFIRTNFNGKQLFETISSGQVKFHVALLKDTVNTQAGTTYNLSDVLSTSEFVGEMVDGVMVADVTLKFQDLAPLTGRTILVLTASALPGFIQFRDGNYISPVGPLVAAGAISFVPSNWSAEILHKNNLKYIGDSTAHAKSVSNFDFFKKTTGFIEVPKTIEITGTPRTSYSTTHFQDLVTALDRGDKNVSAAVRSALCAYLTQEKARGQRLCYGKNMDLLNFRQREVVEEITNPVPERVGITFNEDLTLNMNYLVTGERIIGNGQAAKIGATAALNAGVTAGLNASLNAGLDLDMAPMENKLPGGKLPGFGFLSWLSKFIGNTKPGPAVPIDPADPLGPSVPGNPVPIDPRSSIGAKFGGNIGGTLGFNAGGVASYNNDFYTWTLSNARRETGSISTSVSFKANAEMKVFSFQGKFRKCWLINLSSTMKQQLATAAGKDYSQLGLPSGMYVCSSKVEEGKRSEMFVLVNSITGIVNSPLTDNLDSKEAPLRLFFRGPMGYSVFKNLIMDKKFEVNFNKFPGDKLVKEVQSLQNPGDVYLNQEFPGVLDLVLQ